VLVVSVLACVAASLTVLTGSEAGVPRQIRVLQLNLCNSGRAACFTGRSTTQAAAIVQAHTPHVITLNEACEDDVAELGRAMARAHDRGTVITAFRAAINGYTGRPVACDNGRQFGVGLLVRIPEPDTAVIRHGGLYPMQDNRDELRVWQCVHVVARFSICTTHLPDGAAAIARAQCAYLFHTAVPSLHTLAGTLPTIIGGDLNLGTAETRMCVPRRYTQADDGIVQYVLATEDLDVASARLIDMRGTTDHPALLANLDGDLPSE
jgi:hypothetical protein